MWTTEDALPKFWQGITFGGQILTYPHETSDFLSAYKH